LGNNSVSFKDMFRLDGKKAIITGGGGGIGSAIAHGFVELGADLALLDRDITNAEKVSTDLKKEFPVKVLAIEVDVCSPKDVEKAVDSFMAVFGQVDILVNCHGIGQWVASEEMAEEDWRRMIDINLNGVFFMCQAVGRHMIKNGQGKIVNIASMSGTIVNTPQSQAHYNASKAGVIMLTKSLAAEWAKHDIQVNSVSPGYTLTKMVTQFLKDQPQYKRDWESRTPMGRLATPSDIVGPVVFLASEASRYVTGHDLIVDGGYTIW
jgi:NAD(P)-dependent dehydrogenase (short-subunit alcohol dehydrogenase family)